jgi:hypothetical protein
MVHLPISLICWKPLHLTSIALEFLSSIGETTRSERREHLADVQARTSRRRKR